MKVTSEWRERFLLAAQRGNKAYLRLALADIAGLKPDTPVGILADWFEDHGEPEGAEFIRKHLRSRETPSIDYGEREWEVNNPE